MEQMQATRKGSVIYAAAVQFWLQNRILLVSQLETLET